MKHVKIERRGQTGWVTIDRAEALNALSGDVLRGLLDAWTELAADPAVRLVAVTGAGDRAFCAGADLKERRGMSAAETQSRIELTVRCCDRLARLPKLTVAALNGGAFGGGFEIALACDLVVASRTARFALPESRRGVVASSGALFRAMRALPLNVARELLITGAVLDADRQLGHREGFHIKALRPEDGVVLDLGRLVAKAHVQDRFDYECTDFVVHRPTSFVRRPAPAAQFGAMVRLNRFTTHRTW